MRDDEDEDILRLIHDVYADEGQSPTERVLDKALQHAEGEQRHAARALAHLTRRGTPSWAPGYDPQSASREPPERAEELPAQGKDEASVVAPTQVPPQAPSPGPPELTQRLGPRELTRRVKEVTGGHVVSGRGREVTEGERTHASYLPPRSAPAKGD